MYSRRFRSPGDPIEIQKKTVVIKFIDNKSVVVYKLYSFTYPFQIIRQFLSPEKVDLKKKKVIEKLKSYLCFFGWLVSWLKVDGILFQSYIV